MDHLSDVELMELIRDDASVARRDEAFRQLIRRHQKKLVHYLYRLTGSYDTALDLTQEAFLRVFAARATYQPVAAFSTWLYRIATNLGINETRLARNRFESPMVSSRDDDDTPPDWMLLDTDGVTPEMALARRQLRERLIQHLEGMSDIFRIPVLLKDLLGFSYEEIGEVTSVSVGTVKSRIHRGRKMLAESLQQHDAETLQAYL